MSQENVEIVRGFVEAWSAHDRAEVARYLHPNAVFHSAVTDVVGETFYGRDQIVSVIDRWEKDWSAVRFEVDELIDVDEDRVVTFHKVIATGRVTGIETARELGSVVEVREGLIVRQWIYLDRNEALEAAGLSE